MLYYNIITIGPINDYNKCVIPQNGLGRAGTRWDACLLLSSHVPYILQNQKKDTVYTQ